MAPIRVPYDGDRDLYVRGERCIHQVDHAQVQAYLAARVETHRDWVGLARNWSIAILVFCPEAMPQEAESLLRWDDEVFYAELAFRCDLSQEMHRWLVLHELMELQTYREGDWMRDLLESPIFAQYGQDLRESVFEEYRKLRNQSIEERVYGYMLTRRPGHLATEEFYRSRGWSALPHTFAMKEKEKEEVQQEEGSTIEC